MNRAAARGPLSFQMLVVRSTVLYPIDRRSAAGDRIILPGVPPSRALRAAAVLIANEHSRVWFVTVLMSALGIVAVVVSMIGACMTLSGVLNRVAARSVCAWLSGRDPGDIVTMVVVESLHVVAIALSAGLSLALAASFAVSRSEVSPMDPATIAVVVVLLAGSASGRGVLASTLRQCRIDPVDASSAVGAASRTRSSRCCRCQCCESVWSRPICRA